MRSHYSASHLSICGVSLEGTSHGGDGLCVIIILSMHSAQQAPGIHIVGLPLNLSLQGIRSLRQDAVPEQALGLGKAVHVGHEGVVGLEDIVLCYAINVHTCNRQSEVAMNVAVYIVNVPGTSHHAGYHRAWKTQPPAAPFCTFTDYGHFGLKGQSPAMSSGSRPAAGRLMLLIVFGQPTSLSTEGIISCYDAQSCRLSCPG